MDRLSNVLSAISVAKSNWSIIQLASDQGFSLLRSRALECFFVIEGAVYVRGQTLTRVSAGEAILCLDTKGLTISSAPAGGEVAVLKEDGADETMPWFNLGDSQLISLISRVRIEAPIIRSMSLFRFLPDLIATSSEDYFSVPMRGFNAPTAVREMLAGDGGQEIGRRLAEFLLIQILRTHMAKATSSWGDIAIERRVAQAINLMHTEPAKRWTVENLSEEVGMSRAAFAKEFTEAIGEAPIRHLTDIRMTHASEILRSNSMPLAEVAHHVGYASDIAFVRAFKRFSGFTPAQYRGKQDDEQARSTHFRAAHPAFVFDT